MWKKLTGFLGWIGAGLVVAAIAIWFFMPEWDVVRSRIALGGLVCLLLYMLGEWREIAGTFSRRNVRYGTLTIINVLAVLGILAGVNYVASRQNKRWDLTVAKQFSLSDQTKKLVQNLSEPVTAKVFTRRDDFDRFRDRLREYEHNSKLFRTEYVDVYGKPLEARKYQIQQEGTVVFEYRDRTERVTSDSEQELTNGLIKILTGQQKKIYFLQGHGERDTVSGERTGYTQVVQALGLENFGADKLVLAQVGKVPADAAVLIVAGPQADLFPSEIDAIKEYLGRGGKALFLVDPPDKPKAPPLTNLVALLREWNIEVGENIVVDASDVGRFLGTDPSVPIAANYPPHPITDRFRFITAYPLARSVAPVSGSTGTRMPQTFVETSQASWAETDMQKLATSGEVKMEESAGDKPGPISIAVAVSAAATAESGNADTNDKGDKAKRAETRIAVFGDADFASNGFLRLSKNADLFLNTVNWLAQQETQIAIRAKEPDDRRLTLTADQQKFVNWLSFAIIPGIFFISGIYVWWKRR